MLRVRSGHAKERTPDVVSGGTLQRLPPTAVSALTVLTTAALGWQADNQGVPCVGRW